MWGTVLAGLLWWGDVSSLVTLDLRHNAINNECAEVLVISLVNNTKLNYLYSTSGGSRLFLPWGGNRFINLFARGLAWSIRTNQTTLQYSTNNNARQTSQTSVVCTWQHSWARQCYCKDKAVQTHMECHFKGGTNLGPLLDLDIKLMPFVFGWINRWSKRYHFGQFWPCGKNNFIYHILQKWNVECAIPLWVTLHQKLLPLQMNGETGGRELQTLGGKGEAYGWKCPLSQAAEVRLIMCAYLCKSSSSICAFLLMDKREVLISMHLPAYRIIINIEYFMQI